MLMRVRPLYKSEYTNGCDQETFNEPILLPLSAIGILKNKDLIHWKSDAMSPLKLLALGCVVEPGAKDSVFSPGNGYKSTPGGFWVRVTVYPSRLR